MIWKELESGMLLRVSLTGVDLLSIYSLVKLLKS